MIQWDEVQKAIFPTKRYEDACHRLEVSLGYPFVREAYNFSLPELEDYTQRLLGGDGRGRYAVYNSQLIAIIKKLYQAGMNDVAGLKDRIASRALLELLVEQSGISASEIAMLLKYLLYWVIPTEKYLSSLVRDDPSRWEAARLLGNAGIRMNLELLQAGITKAGRQSLAHQTGLQLGTIIDLVNRADFSRLPWASKATISNIIGAGYASLSQLASADLDILKADFFGYGRSIGKNLKLGNEIESSYRIAKIVPKILRES